ncbi:NIPSNAP family protein [Pseudonocardia benzenivorans]
MLYEVREYVVTPGRLESLITRFKEHALPLFVKHQMDLVQIGVTSVGDHSFNEVVYMLRFTDVADMERKWGRSSMIRSGSPRFARARRTAHWCSR